MRLSAVRWVFVTNDDLEPGRLVRVTEPGSEMLWEVCEGEMSPEALEELNAKHILLVNSGVWSREPDVPAGQDRPSRVIEGSYVIVPGEWTPPLKGELFITHEEDGIATMMIPEGHLSEALRVQLNEVLKRFLARGAWVRWAEFGRPEDI